MTKQETNWKCEVTGISFTCTSDCSKCGRVVVVERSSSLTPESYEDGGEIKLRGWGGSINEYYCSVCGDLVCCEDNRECYGE